ncbi:HAD family hydrolase [Pantoea sp. ACRSB]|uniref:HAD family hydrolase n=1 Tax=Pantoea sp. ACRSB TaxID=2918207 RepID=UPI002893097E|nr:HAD family hydrolase [Pantoea sp. ACRSB]MCG7388446.1 HAD family hydrolase [Pantoea sp. ACRSB]
MNTLNKIKLVAVDVDGVLLNDTYSPAIKSFVELHGGVYTPELERLVWGSPHIAGGHNMSLTCKLPWSAQKTIDAFFNHHMKYIKAHPIEITPGAEDFLKILQEFNVRVTSYGGRTKEYIFDKYLSSLRRYFDNDKPYIDTNSIRPGVMEITRDIFKLNFDEVLFIDDINRLAEVAKFYKTAFIGTPVTTYQKEQMLETGVRYIIPSVREFTSDMLISIDKEIVSNNHW